MTLRQVSFLSLIFVLRNVFNLNYEVEKNKLLLVISSDVIMKMANSDCLGITFLLYYFIVLNC